MIEKIETEVMQLMLGHEFLIGKELPRIIKRDFSGVGFYSQFERNSFKWDGPINTVGAILNDNILVGFDLFQTDDGLDFLEGYTFDGAWPEVIYSYKTYVEAPNK